MRTLAISILMLFISSSVVLGESAVDRIINKDRLIREDIKKKDEERRARIIKKFADFQKKVLNFAPGFKLKMPVSIDHAADINKLDADARMKKAKRYSAYSADNYKLRSLPYDTIKEYTASVKRGQEISVLMKPLVKKNKKYFSITRDWLLVRTSDGTEGYIPQNLVLSKNPSRKIIKSGFLTDEDAVSVRLCGLNGANSVSENTGSFMPVQYSEGENSGTEAKMMKVNTTVLNIRTEASIYSEIAGSLYKNDTVEVLEYSAHSDYYNGINSKWARIKADNFTGWVFAYYLREISENETRKNDFISYLSDGASLYVKSDILRVRDAPDDMGTVLFSIQNKDNVTITEIEDEEVTLGGKKSKWVQILDYEGWVFGAFLSEDKNSYEEGDDINNLFQVPIAEGNNYFISSKFGKRILSGKVNNHTGVDLAAACRTKVVSSADGTVLLVVRNNRNCSRCGYGNYVIVEHKNGYRTVYGHLTSVSVKTGQKLNSGDKVGTVGNTGHSYGCHLNFEIRAYEEFVDPLKYIHP